jgi:hypothetical protein
VSATLDQRLRVEAVFAVHGDDEDSAYAALTELIDRLNQVANLPECECDLHISVQRGPAHSLARDGLPATADPVSGVEAARL